LAKYDYIKLAKKSRLTEKELNALKNALNNNKDYKLILKAFYQNKRIYDAEGINLDKEQIAKGGKYLYNLGFSPKGKERKNSPYGYREMYIVDNLKTIKLLDFYDAGNRSFSFYVPYYQAIGKDGTSMDYFVSGGKINIYG